MKVASSVRADILFKDQWYPFVHIPKLNFHAQRTINHKNDSIFQPSNWMHNYWSSRCSLIACTVRLFHCQDTRESNILITLQLPAIQCCCTSRLLRDNYFSKKVQIRICPKCGWTDQHPPLSPYLNSTLTHTWRRGIIISRHFFHSAINYVQARHAIALFRFSGWLLFCDTAVHFRLSSSILLPAFEINIAVWKKKKQNFLTWKEVEPNRNSRVLIFYPQPAWRFLTPHAPDVHQCADLRTMLTSDCYLLKVYQSQRAGQVSQNCSCDKRLWKIILSSRFKERRR